MFLVCGLLEIRRALDAGIINTDRVLKNSTSPWEEVEYVSEEDYPVDGGDDTTVILTTGDGEK